MYIMLFLLFTEGRGGRSRELGGVVALAAADSSREPAAVNTGGARARTPPLILAQYERPRSIDAPNTLTALGGVRHNLTIMN